MRNRVEGTWSGRRPASIVSGAEPASTRQTHRIYHSLGGCFGTRSSPPGKGRAGEQGALT